MNHGMTHAILMKKGPKSRMAKEAASRRPLPLPLPMKESSTITSSNKLPQKAISKPAPRKKASKKYAFYVIRECDSLHGPALFLSWKDCSFYLDPDENDGPVEFKEFEILQAAFDYISDFAEPQRKETMASKRTAQEIDSSASPLPSKKQKTAPTPAKGKAVAIKASPGKISPDHSVKEPPKAVATPAPSANKEQLPVGFPTMQPLSPMVAQFPFHHREITWERTFRLFHEFKAIYGHLKPEREEECDSKFDAIQTCHWIGTQRKQIHLWTHERKDHAFPILNDDRVARLNELLLLPSHRTHAEDNWEERYALFKEFKEYYGHLTVSKEKDLDPRFEVLGN
jgi:hypothetical protein